MDTSAIGTVAGVVVAVGGLAWKLGSAWTHKAMALGAKAEAEKATSTEVAELRRSHAEFMKRWQDLETEVKVLKARVEEREVFRRDTQGIPVRNGE